MNVGDYVTHPTHPNEVGSINKILYHSGNKWYRVTWPSGVGTDGVFREDSDLEPANGQ